MRRTAVVLWFLSLPACHPAAAPASQGAGAAPSPPRPTDRTPRGQGEYPTTEGSLALSNLESQLEGQEKILAATKNVEVNATLANLLLLHGRITGRIADYERAEQLMDELVKVRPKSPIAWRVHGAVNSTFHRFDQALADYDRAEKAGEKHVELVAPRMEIAAARGAEDDVLAYRKKMAKELPGIDTLGALAAITGQLGDVKTAEKLFGDAQDSYRNVSPFPVAMLYFQEGLMAERAGSPARARMLFEAAHARLPGYAQATAHLAIVTAQTGNRPRAIELLRPLAQGDDPEYAGELSEMLKQAGDGDEAAAMRGRAAARYDVLTKKYPLAFSDHAARFLIATGGDAARALALALQNLKNRPTAEAYRLAIDAAVAAHSVSTACQLAEALLRRAHVLPAERVAAAKAFVICDQRARADREVAAAIGAR